ncbi:hypothetical protein Moror_1532 [Moniliophthora roreri MCA 2997]|uniref:Uncharacterized protein n=1 Tax=Moniliophthora roreri (strain MCA 2997) TaxID=1381753 RepID=V2YPP4_MONRO|nr:hypothetical protein Moror_1532 [Moniliophthora roreri MCA 2997]KAI3609505.1 hypothetical protein WG66_001179 [Moniliophthora roreri]
MIALLPVVALSFFFALAGQVTAQRDAGINATVGGQLVLASQFLDGIDFSTEPLASCNTNCSATKSILTTPGVTNATLCDDSTAASLLACQQCMYEALIKANKPLPDPKAGSTPLLQGYQTSCKEVGNKPLNKTQVALVVPPFWDGPLGIGIPTAGLPFAVGFAAIFGTSAIVMLSTM